VKRSILERLLLRIEAMKFGWTYIERGITGGVKNAVLKPFDSFTECCAAAAKVANTSPVQPVERVDVVPCEYDDGRCHPQVMSVMKTFQRSPRPT